MLDRLLARWPLKLLALGVAYGIWLSVTSQGKVFTDIDVPLVIELNPALALAGSPPPAKINVQVRGAENAIRNLDPLQLSMQVRLHEAVPGRRSVALGEEQLQGLARGIEVTRLAPERLTLTVEPRLQRLVPVEADLVGSLPDGYELYAVQVIPHSIEVDGPESAIAETESIRTEPVSLDDRTQPTSVEVGVLPEAPSIRVLGARRVDVRLVVDASAVRRVFDGVLVHLDGARYESRVEPGTTRVTISGPPAVVESLHDGQVRAVADISALEPGSQAQRVPLDVEILDLNPQLRARLSTTARREVSVFVSSRRIGP